MQKIWSKFQTIPLIKRLNNYPFMPVIWWSLLVVIMPYILSLLKIPIVLREGIVFLIINSVICYFLGKLIKKRSLSRWWLLCLPIVFDLAMIPRFAKYNYVFGVIYLIFEVFGLISDRIYR